MKTKPRRRCPECGAGAPRNWRGCDAVNCVRGWNHGGSHRGQASKGEDGKLRAYHWDRHTPEAKPRLDVVNAHEEDDAPEWFTEVAALGEKAGKR